MTTTDDGQLLLQAILAHPEEDTPRLMYADWLEEDGQPERSEFIRLQVELDVLDREHFDHVLRRWDSKQSDQRSWELVKRDRELRKKYSREWLPRGVFDADHDLYDPLLNTLAWFRRGFVHRMECFPPDWLRHYREILSAHPVQEVMFRNRPETVINSMGNEGLRDDPEQRMFTAWELHRKAGSALGDWTKAICELRWPGITFHIQGA